MRIGPAAVLTGLIALGGCMSAAGRPVDPDAVTRPVGITAAEVTATRAWQIYDAQQKTPVAVMRYFINLVRYSEKSFVRNDIILPGRYAAEGLDFKFRKHHDEAGDVGEFIENIGSFSKKTGKKYYVVMEDGSLYPMREALYYEWERLGKAGQNEEN